MHRSLPSRGAWIEIIPWAAAVPALTVAPLAGSVDRNRPAAARPAHPDVAPLAGSVDRNVTGQGKVAEPRVSLPSRGAWIEIAS